MERGAAAAAAGGGQILAKYWSKTGQILVEYRVFGGGHGRAWGHVLLRLHRHRPAVK